jgi:DNA-binding CsgD family transcriptional regulator/tetratricopeptide (TPR) repeat protein
MTMKLLERDDLLAKLQAQLLLAATGPGILVFIEGEAGIGKTAVLKWFADVQRTELPVRWGACDALQTPRPLGPLYDIAAQASGELRIALDNDVDRVRVFGAFLDLLRAQPSLVLLEDLHWADQATLDLLRYIGRRIARTRSLVVATFRSDELGPAHPLRLLLGDLATSGVQRYTPQPLTLGAVRELAGDRDVDVPELHRKTGGNPFFVTEVLAAGGLDVPITVRDAVLTRAMRLRPSARAILDAAAVAGPRVEPWLLQDLAAAESSAVEECLATGVLRVDDGVFIFRHELARQAILQSLTPTRLLSLHRLVLQALQSPAAPTVDLARLAHHAEGAGLEAAVLQFAPAAARDAAAKGAHRQAAQQFARALRHAPSVPAERASLLDDYASECQLSGLLDDAIGARQSAAKLWQEAGDTEREAISLSRLAHALVVAGRNAAGEAAMRAAKALVAPDSESAAAVATRRWAAYLRMLDRDVEDAIRDGTVALIIAERLADQPSVVHCLNTIGSSMIVAGRIEEGRHYLERSRAMAERLQSDFWVANALSNLGSACGEAYCFELAEDYLRRGIEYCTERDIDFSRLYQLSWLALVQLYRGRWIEASKMAHAVLTDRRSPATARITALIALGRLRARRGDPAVWEALNEARELAGNTGTLQRVAPMQAARAEAAWLEGRSADAAGEALVGVELAMRKRHSWFTSELLFWCRQGNGSMPVELPEFCARHPFALEVAGLWQEAAAGWRALGCPFETARSLAAGDETAQREALTIFEALGARPMIERVHYKLRAAGVRGLPRGPRETTQKHPAGLTIKEIAVLALLAQGLRNKEIGQRLHRSARTVDHHLASIFAKLGVATRAEAVSAAYRLGVISVAESGASSP